MRRERTTEEEGGRRCKKMEKRRGRAVVFLLRGFKKNPNKQNTNMCLQPELKNSHVEL